MPLLTDQRLLVTGVATADSIAFAVARTAQEQGAEVILSTPPRYRQFTEGAAKELPRLPEILDLDVTIDDHYPALADALREKWGGVDGALHAIAYAPRKALGGEFLNTSRRHAITAFETSALSYSQLGSCLAPLMAGGSYVGLTFDATVAWPVYDHMGVAKAALESSNRYLARYLGPQGIRCNIVAAGPLNTVSASAIPGFDDLAQNWGRQAPIGWNPADLEPTANAICFLLSPLSAGMTGSVMHVDGGVHAMGAPLDIDLEARQDLHAAQEAAV